MSLSSFSSIGQLIKFNNIGIPPGPGLNNISSQNIIFYYPFESADVKNSTCRNNIISGTYDLTLTGTPVQTSVYKNGSGSLETSVSKFAYLTTPTNYYSTTQSFCFKFYMTAISGYVALLHSLAGSSGNTLIFMVQIYNSPPSALRVVFNNPSYKEISISSSIAINTWYSVCIVKNGTSIQTYLNGVATGSVSDGNSYLTTTNQINRLYFGTDSTQPSYYINGYMDDIRVYNRAISSTEAQNLHNSIV